MVLHTPTMFLVIMLTCVVMGVAIAGIAYRRHADLLLWSAGLILHGLGYALYSLRGQIADVLSIVVANIAIASALALFCEGILRFQERVPQRWLLWMPVAIAAVGFSVLLDNQRARFVLASLLFSAQAVMMLVSLRQRWRETPGRGKYILAVGITTVLGVMLVRMTVVLLGLVRIAVVTESSPVQTYTYVATILAILFLSLGLVMMNQERAEQALERERQTELFRSQILEQLSRGVPLRQLLTTMVQGIEQRRPGMLCSVLLLDRDGKRFGDGVAPSLPTFFNDVVHNLSIGPGVGSCGTAAATGQRVIVEDIARHPDWAPFAAQAAQAGLASCWSQPILSAKGDVLGTFAIYHREPHAPSPADIGFIEQFASLTSIAIERSRETVQLRQSEERYRRLVNGANEGICVVQGESIRFANPKLCELIGQPEAQILGRSILDFIHEDDGEMVMRNRRRRLQGEEFQYPVRVMTQHQGARWFELSGTLFEWEGKPATLNFLTDITDRKQMDERVRQFAYHDALTGLPNRRLLMDRLQLAMARHKRSGQHGALMFLDLDNFKPLNDRYGHDVGDLLLIEVARRLKSLVREADTVARFGGDEFVVIINDLDVAYEAAHVHALTVAGKALESLTAAYRLSVPQPHEDDALIEHRCSASIGVVLFQGEPGTEDERLKQADAAMYQAKQAGRQAIKVYDVRAQAERRGLLA